ncbi:MAG: ATP-dependent DNA helicase RecG [Patescibacteria group bacterium]|nr:ATP-dependent DNA helicase RecG [Patescibacteria group bacterium]
MITLLDKAENISPIAKKLSSKLKKIGIETIEDLIFYYPFRYDDFSQIKQIKDLIPGDMVTISGRVDLIQNRRSPRQRKNITEAIISDKSDSIKVIWFNQPYLTKNIRQGENIYLSGKVNADYNTLQMISPEYEKVKNFTSNTACLAPVYHLTAGITNKQIRFLIRSVLPLAVNIIDWLPLKIKLDLRFMDLSQALRQVHFPENKVKLNSASIRLKFNELFLAQLQTFIIRDKIKNSLAEKVEFKENEIKSFVSSLPFKLTDDQKKSAWAVLKDTQKSYPMNRLIEGEVGSGKTVVAAIAILNTVLNKKQSAYMAPTEILAKQHFKSLQELYKNFEIQIGLFTRTEQKICSEKKKIKKNDFIKKIKNGEVDIVVGTHSLIQEKVDFKNLCLAIIDEQHRFGVEQRKSLKEKSGNKKTVPHFLSMTATPIPRTLHLALYGDLDLSIIKEMPKGRKKVITKIIEPIEREKTYNFIRNQINQGRQVFVVCPLINESDKLGVKSVKEEYEKLSKKIFLDFKIGVIHGKLRTKEKEKIMSDFLTNKIKILVATSIVEVGVDVANASIMIIEGAERFGLAQLHQFRGRVGRSDFQSYCFLFNENLSEKTQERLEALVKCNDGFELAKIDLEFRGYGEIYGKIQSGISEFKIATLFDYKIIEKAKVSAEYILNLDLTLNKFSELKKKMDELNKNVHLE